MIKKFGMENCKAVNSLFDILQKLYKVESCKQLSKIAYQNLIGSLMYLSTSKRADLAYTVSMLCQCNIAYTQDNWIAAKHVLHYLKGIKDYCLNYDFTDI